MTFAQIRKAITEDDDNKIYTESGYSPLFTGSEDSRILIIGQAPGKKAQESGIPWDDISGKNLRGWLGITDKQFYDDSLVSIVPMDFYFPGKGKTGDLPPRKDFAPKWHPQILGLMPDIQLTILIGQYAQRYYLSSRMKSNLTETVRSFEEYLPEYFPTPHPSPLNARWMAKNSFFVDDALPKLKNQVIEIIS